MNMLREENRLLISLAGELTVSNAATLRTGILEALGQGEQVELDLEGVSEVDLAGLQLLCSAHRSALAQGKTLTLINAQIPALEKARQAAGFVFHRSCKFNPAGECFWIGGRKNG
jgi:anti-anti-sigma factor